jgi:glycerol uptake facilitator-like aquaporin
VFFAAFASGAHINPSVSIASALSGHLYWARALLYIVAQVWGALNPQISMGDFGTGVLHKHLPSCPGFVEKTAMNTQQ